MNYDAITDKTDLAVIGYLAFRYIYSGYTNLRCMDNLSDFATTQNNFSDLRRQHTGHSILHIIDSVINYAIETDIYLVLFCQLTRVGIRTDIKADNDRI